MNIERMPLTTSWSKFQQTKMDALASAFLHVYSNPFSTEIFFEFASTRVQTPQHVSLRRTHVGFYVFRHSRREILVYMVVTLF